MPRRISASQARRIAIHAQRLDAPHPSRPGPATLSRAIGHLSVLQLDSVNVFERSHYLPLFSRLGAYDRRTLDRLLHHDHGRSLGAFTEYTAHEAAVLPVADWPLWAWRRHAPVRDGYRKWATEHAALIDEVQAEFRQRGALKVSELEHEDNVRLGGGWWNHNTVRIAAEWLFRHGELVTVGRDRFERVLALADEVLPAAARAAVPRDEALRELVRRAARGYGVATLDDLADHPRVKGPSVRAAVDALEASGELEPVEVEGWGRPAWLAAGTRIPRSVTAATVLSPFDPLVWYRPRAMRIFGFHYRISIYTPAAQREHGYYVLPVLVDDDLVGRLDLKSDRKAGVLLVQHAHVEPASHDRRLELARRLAPVLASAAGWQGLTDVQVVGPGTWADDLRVALR